MTDRVGVARRLAKLLHHDQRRKSGEAQFAHCERVAEAVREHGEQAVVVAYLHDLLEDTGIDPAVIEGLFGAEVEQDVDYLTRNELDTYTEYIRCLTSSGSETALRVKLADLRDNLSSAEDWAPTLIPRYKLAQAEVVRELNNREYCRPVSDGRLPPQGPTGPHGSYPPWEWNRI